MKRKRLLTAAAGTLVAAAVAGVAWAAIPGPGNVYTACVLKGIGQLRLIDKSLPSTNPLSHCLDKETEVSWNQAGQPGGEGRPGPKGADGATGPAGAKGDKGDPGNLALAGRSCADGTFVTGFDAQGDLVCAAPANGGGGDGGGGSGGISANPTHLDFPSTPVGGVSEAAVLKLTSASPVDVPLQVTFDGGSLVDFLAGGCQTVPAEGTCDMTIRFRPIDTGSRIAVMTIHGPNGQIVLVTLSGIGT